MLAVVVADVGGEGCGQCQVPAYAHCPNDQGTPKARLSCSTYSSGHPGMSGRGGVDPAIGAPQTRADDEKRSSAPLGPADYQSLGGFRWKRSLKYGGSSLAPWVFLNCSASACASCLRPNALYACASALCA